MSALPRSDGEAARGALRRARAVRGEWLLAIAEGVLGPTDLIRHAATPEGRPLLLVPLRQVLLAQPGWGEKRSDEVLDRIVAFSGSERPKRLTVGWLLDPRVAAARWLAYCDAMSEIRSCVPWSGFPFTPGPAITRFETVGDLAAKA